MVFGPRPVFAYQTDADGIDVKVFVWILDKSTEVTMQSGDWQRLLSGRGSTWGSIGIRGIFSG